MTAVGGDSSWETVISSLIVASGVLPSTIERRDLKDAKRGGYLFRGWSDLFSVPIRPAGEDFRVNFSASEKPR